MLSVVVHPAPSFDDYTFHFVNALSAYARVGYVIDRAQFDRFGSALSRAVTPIPFRRPRRRDPQGLWEMRRVSRAVRQFQPDVFHLQNFGLWESVLLRMIGGTTVINTVHDPILHIDYRNILNEALTRDAIHRAKGWVVHSPHLKQVFLKQYPLDPERVLIHPLGVHDYYCRFAPAGVAREKTILFFGELRVNKGFDLLLHAFHSIKDRLDGWKLVIAGRGRIAPDLETLMHELGDQLVYQNRYVPDAEVADLFSRAGIVALPYRHGSQSAVLGIAAAFGCPVLATAAGNMAEIMEDGKHAYFVEADSEPSLAQGLLHLAKQDELRKLLGENLKEYAKAQWSWEEIARKTIDFYHKILQAPSTSTAAPDSPGDRQSTPPPGGNQGPV